MENMRDLVEATITFGFRTFGARPRPVQADLRYAPADPYAVFIGFHTGRGTVQWMFGRDLLVDGLLTPSGEGDVIVRPATHPALVLVELNTPGGSAVLEAPADQLAAFVNRTYEVVAPGEEQTCFDFDVEMSKLV